MPRLDRLAIHGFKSIRALEDFELRALNVLIGPNGSGKTNFIDLFRMLARMADGRLQVFVAEQDVDRRLCCSVVQSELNASW